MAERQGVGDLFDLIKNYAKQETTEPLKGAGRWIGFGVAGSVLLMLGGIFMTLATLRLIQEEGPSWTTGNLSWLPYIVTLVVVAITIVVLAWRIRKKTL